VPERRGLIVDWGGVLTTDVFASFRAFCVAEGLAPDTVRDLFREDPRARELLAGLETGELDRDAFQTGFAPLLGVAPEGIVERLFGQIGPDEAMIGAVRAARAAGLRTGLLSNSWRVEDYDRALLEELFDAWVISGEVGLRKPDPAIYALTLERLDLPAEACVFIDDLEPNIVAARECGLHAVHFRDTEQTIDEVRTVLATA
jgi:putative hydrolase of the HAD superfamily